MENSYSSYSDEEIMKALITHDFSEINRQFVDNVVTSIKAGAFYAAKDLDTVSLPMVTKVGHNAFTDTNLATLELTWSGLTDIGHEAFFRGWHRIPENLVLSNATTVGNGAFAGTSTAKNTRLKTISFPKWEGARPTAQGFSANNTGLFDYCSALTSVNLPLLTSLSSYMFRGCTALETINLPKVSTLSNGVFTGCTALKKIDFGGAITSITNTFLPSGTTFEALILRGVTTVPTLGTSVFRSTPVSSGDAYIYVPSSLEALFKVANNWSTYAAQIRAIENYPEICG